MNTIKINDKEYKIKYTIRALFIFEQITQKQFKLETTLDSYIFFYSMILANNLDNPLLWDEYIDAIDKDPSILKDIEKIVVDTLNINKMIEGDKEEGNEEKKS